MSDFLASLIDRAVNREPVLERRRRSRFEPGPTPANATVHDPDLPRRAPHSDEGDLEATLESGTAAAPAPQRSQRALRARRAPPQAAPDESVADEFSASPAPASLTEARLLQRSGDTAREIQKQEPMAAHRPSSPQIDQTVRAPSASAKPHREARVTEFVAANPDRRERREPGAAAEPVPPPAKPARSARVPPLEPGASPTRPPRAADKAPLKPAALRPAEVAPVSRAPRPAAKSERPPLLPLPAAEPPPIHVTIGRLEIRATSQAGPPSRARKPAAPKLTLDEYLRSRNGGAR